MNKHFYFGEQVEGYEIPVLNEREIRAAAGILFLLIYTSLMLIIFKENFFMMKFSITIFMVDFLVRVFVNPKYAPSLIIGHKIVNRQNPEYVGASQKKFAWVIGVGMAVTMFLLMVVFNTFSIITGLICLFCLIFLLFESMFGICLGCLFYGWYYKKKAQYCPGEICDIKSKQDIQKINSTQWIMVLGMVLFIVILAVYFQEYLSLTPTALWGK